MISNAHDFVDSGENQKQNAADEFLTRFRYQRDNCDEIREELKDNRNIQLKK